MSESYQPRFIATIVVKDGQHVQSFDFGRYLPVGDPAETAREYDRWGVDEIILTVLDSYSENMEGLIREVAGAISVPLTVAGGVQSVECVKSYLSWGADKVSVNQALVTAPDVVGQSVETFGAQCIVASVDLWEEERVCYRFDHWEKKRSNIDAEEWVKTVSKLNVGEVFFNFPQRDGTQSGLACNVVSGLKQYLTCPMIVCGGTGSTSHILECWEAAQPSAVAVGNVLSHFEHSVIAYKEALKRAELPVREGVRANYHAHKLDASGRPERLDNEALDDLLFQRIESEKI
ncbi:MAG: HisA/HisF-related TIM barrel protein [Verrucomicrobiota bacterium]